MNIIAGYFVFYNICYKTVFTYKNVLYFVIYNFDEVILE